MVYTRPALGDPGNSGPTAATTIIDALSDGLEALEYGTFNVRSYGAAGDGATNDTSAINAAIAALNSAGRGVLYFPPGDYLVTAGLTAITAKAHIRGEGRADANGTAFVSRISINSASATLLTIGGHGTTITDLGIRNTATTPTSGAGIYVTSGDGANLTRVSVFGFYDNIDFSDGFGWQMTDCLVFNAVRYGLRIRHIDLPDGGDMSITGTLFYTNRTGTTAHLRWESGGGLKISNCKFNNYYTGSAVTCFDASFGTGVLTSDLQMTNCSLENYSGTGIRIAVTGSGAFNNVGITNNQICPFVASANGIQITGGVKNVAIVGNHLSNGVSFSGTGINVNGTSQLTIGLNTYKVGTSHGWSSLISLTSCTSVNNLDATYVAGGA